MQRPGTHSFPSVAATIRAEIVDAVGSGRRSPREALSVAMIVACAAMLGVGALVLALVR